MTDRIERVPTYEQAHSTYDHLVGMALAAGWQRVPGNRVPSDSELWWQPDYTDGVDIGLGEVIEIILRDHGVDLREPVPGEEAT